jgi:tetratricopeptide (TPR) repeat protein
MAQRLLRKPCAGKSNVVTKLTQTQGEEAQLLQTIEMFEVIVQSQPNDCQSLEILKEAYSKLGRDKDVINTSKRIAQAYMQQGQLSSAILEYETVLQRQPDDADVQAALKQIEDKANNVTVAAAGVEPVALAEETKLRKSTMAARRCRKFSLTASSSARVTLICAGACRTRRRRRRTWPSLSFIRCMKGTFCTSKNLSKC